MIEIFKKNKWCFLLAFTSLIYISLFFKSYGLGWDEPIHIEYGKRVWLYLTTLFSDKSFRFLFNLRFYGGWVDLFSLIWGKILGVKNEASFYYLKHFVTASIGMTCLIPVYRMSRIWCSERISALTAILLLTTPLFHGHLFHNPKDIPFAAVFTWAIYFMIRYLDKLRPKDFLIFCILTGFALGIRSGAILLYLYFAVFYLLSRGAKGLTELKTYKVGIQLFLVSYLVAAIAWPYIVYKPLKGLIESVLLMSNFSYTEGTVLFEGSQVKIQSMPRHYIAKIFAMKLPEWVVLFFPLGIWGMFWKNKKRKLAAVIAVAALFPAVYASLRGSAVYNGVRQFLFLYPSLLVLVVVGTAQIFERRSWGKMLLSSLILLQVGVNLVRVYRYFPYEYTSYNWLSGKAKSLEGKYEFDYWALALYECAQYLNGESEKKEAKIEVYSYLPGSLYAPFLKSHIVLTDHLDQANFVLYRTEDGQTAPEGMTLVHEIKRAGISYARIYGRTN